MCDALKFCYSRMCMEPQQPFSRRALRVVPVNLPLPFFFKQKILGFPQGPKNKIKMQPSDSRAINWNIQVHESYSEFSIKGVLHTEVLVIKEFVILVFDHSLLLLFTTLKGALTGRLNSHFLMKKQSDAYSQFTPAGWHCQKMSILRSTSWLKMTYQVQT